MDALAWTALTAFILTLIALAYWRMKRHRPVDYCGWVEEPTVPEITGGGVPSRSSTVVTEQVIAHDKDVQ